MSIVSDIIKNQREELKTLHNKRFFWGNEEFRLTYDEGLAEFINIDSRPCGTEEFRHRFCFLAYKFFRASDALAHAKSIVCK